VKHAWQADQRKIQHALAETAGGIRSAGRVYAATDEAAAGRFAGAGGVEISL